MTTNNSIPVYVISDSLGETAKHVVDSALVQFPDSNFTVEKFPFSRTTSMIDGILNRAKRANAFIIHTLVDPELAHHVNTFCEENDLDYFDTMSPLMAKLEHRTGQHAAHGISMNHTTDKNYFDRIKAIEFAVTYDDGKDPSGFLKADIVLLGISRTSKTPLSLYLANQGYKVANLPLVPQAQIPEEIYLVDKDKIFGLTNDPDVLNNIRRERMIAYGLDPETTYSNTDNITKELEYANNLYRELGCLVINVAHKSIEETATLIMESLPAKDE